MRHVGPNHPRTFTEGETQHTILKQTEKQIFQQIAVVHSRPHLALNKN